MKDFIILHVTDLHIDDITSTNENLRKAFYKEFIDDLAAKVHSTIGRHIDLLLCTGDFVNKGKTINFEHATNILHHFVRKFKITNQQVAVCIGNHDFDITMDMNDKEQEARSPFKTLEEIFHPEHIIFENFFFKIYHFPEEDYYILSFDSTLGSKGGNLPSKLSDSQIDEIITEIDDRVPEEKLLIVMSHYPMILFQRSPIVSETENWVDDHLWKSGNIIVERTYKKRKNGMTFWFFGDGHLPDFWSYNKFHHFLMTGMIGGNYVNPTYKEAATGAVKAFNKTNEVKVVQWKKDAEQIIINTYNYKSKQYSFSPHSGYWEHAISETRVVDNPFEFVAAGTNLSHVGSEVTKSKTLDSLTKLISSSVQEEILTQIRERKLYSFDRYATSASEVSLGWVSITKLFEKNELLSRCIDKTVDWLNEMNKMDIQTNNTIFIGIDFWGAIFASQASIKKNIGNYCIATKSRNEHNVLFEKPEFLVDKLRIFQKKLKNIVLFTDVISTGNTVASVQQKISGLLGPDIVLNWLAVSVISDVQQVRKADLSKFVALGSLCTSLRIPVLNIADLPEEDILPVKYDITN